MSGVSDLYDLSDDERLALCQELGRLTRIVPLSPAAAADPLPRHLPAAAAQQLAQALIEGATRAMRK